MDLALGLFIFALLCLACFAFGSGKSNTDSMRSYDEEWEEARQEVESGLYDEEFDELLATLEEETDDLDMDEELDSDDEFDDEDEAFDDEDFDEDDFDDENELDDEDDTY